MNCTFLAQHLQLFYWGLRVCWASSGISRHHSDNFKTSVKMAQNWWLQCKVHLKNPTIYGAQRSFHIHTEITITVIEIKYLQTLVTVKHSFKEAKMVASDDCSVRFFYRLLSFWLDTEKCPLLHSAAKHCLVERNQALSHPWSWITSINLLCSKTYSTQNTMHCLHPCATGSTLLAKLTCTNSPNTNHIHSNQPTNKRTPPTHISFKISCTAETPWAVITPKYHWEEAKRYWLNGYSEQKKTNG